MTFRPNLFLICAAIGGASFTTLASAQQVDYGSLEQVFGEPVTTSATGSPQVASQAPADMQIITADDIRRSGATNIPDILRFLVGIDVRSYGALDDEVSIRGYSQANNPRLLVLINGRQVYLDDYGYVVWENLPVQLSDIRQIEIVKGPASALFGFNAASGVINIITYDPLTDRTDIANATIGTDGTIAGSVVTTLQDPGKGGVTISLGGLRTREYSVDKQPSSQGPYYTDPHQGSYDIDGRYKPTSNTEATLEITQSQSESEDYNVTDQYAFLALRSNSIKSSVAIDSSLGLITVSGYINQTKTKFVNPGQPNAWSNQTDVVQANDLFKVGDRNAVRLAVEYRNNRVFGSGFDGVIGYQDYAVSAMWNWQINPKLAFTAAGRLDDTELEKSDPLTSFDVYTAADFQGHSAITPTFNIGLVYQPTDYDTLRWLVGRAAQAPSLVDYGLDTQVSEPYYKLVLAGSPDVKPAISTNYEIDYDKTIPALDSTLRTAIYYSINQDIIASALSTVPTFNNGVIESYTANVGSGDVLGGEVGLQGSNPDGWRWNVSYSLAVVRDSLSSGPPETPLQFDDTTPTSSIVLGFGYSWNKFEADVQSKWQSRYDDYSTSSTANGTVYTPVTIANYVTVDGRIGYRLTPRLTIAVSGQQLQAQQTVETAGFPVERRILLSATYGF